nr:ribonuclease toxin immunity protein CdiI [Bacillus subtilis]
MYTNFREFLQRRRLWYRECRCVFADDYEQWEEDYFGDEGIAFYFDYPTVKEDEEVILDYENFYKYLNEIVGQYVERHPDNKLEVEKYMETIKEKYNIKL